MLKQAYADSVWLPLTGSDVASNWNSLWDFLLWLSVFFFVLVVGAMIYLAIKYRKGRPGKTGYITGNHTLEIIWTVIPTVLLMVIFVWGYVVYNQMTRPPSDAMEVKVIGKQWSWTFQYEDGRTSPELYVPVNKPVKLVMSSEDVLHSFFIPNFRVKMDVVPGMYTSVWFEPTVVGKHQVFCTEYCGTAHSEMLTQVNVLDEQQYAAWKRGKDVGPIARAGGELVSEASAAEKPAALALSGLAAQGEKLMQAKGCVACHTTDGTTKIGPSYKGVFGSKREFIDGTSAVADEQYIRESIENPSAKVLKGFQPLMPTFKGQINEQEMNALIAYIKAQK